MSSTLKPADSILVKITVADIRTSEYADCRNCACAKALRRMFPDARDISVGGTYFWIDDVEYGIPPGARDRLLRGNSDARPFTFHATPAPGASGEPEDEWLRRTAGHGRPL
jgi:hypothetical protein